MALLLKFAVALEDFSASEFDRPHGPLFHRWLPNGKADALLINTADPKNKLTIWFERRGFLDSSFIRYDSRRTEVDENTMQRQGKLDAGPLRGEAEFASITSDELMAIREERLESPEYISVGKQVIEFLYPPVSAVIDLLRVQYGQYWLPELPCWDSRSQSLGSYCSSKFNLHWRELESEDWRKFQPTDQRQTIFVTPPSGRAYAEYLTQDDWLQIQSSFKPTAQLPIALRVLGRAHQLNDSEHVNESFIQAVSALELSIEHFLNTRMAQLSVDAAKHAKQLLNLPVKVQLSILAATTSEITQTTLDLALRAVEFRNNIVHEGKKVEDKERRIFLAIAECAKYFLGLNELKTPVLNSGNSLSPPEYGGHPAVILGDKES